MKKQEVFENILPAAILAPSAHNTQPWRFQVGDDWLAVLVDESRHLSVSDPTRRQLYVSLGCALMNIVVAAAKVGVAAQVAYQPSPSVAADVKFAAGSADPQLAALYPGMAARRTDRRLYDAKFLTDQERRALQAPTSPGVQLVEDRGLIGELARLTEEGTVATLRRPDFKAELSQWVRHSWTRRPDGMPGYAMGMPAPVSLLAPLMVKVAPIHKQEGPKARWQMESASAVAVITTPGDTTADWMRAGQLMEQLWLEATQAGLAAAPLASAIEANAPLREQVKRVLQTDQYPQAIIRLGHSGKKNLHPTPRRTVEDCLVR